MATRTATAEWKGDLPSGTGRSAARPGISSGNYSFESRFKDDRSAHQPGGAGRRGAGRLLLDAARGDARAGRHTSPSRSRPRPRCRSSSRARASPSRGSTSSPSAASPASTTTASRRSAEAAKETCLISKALGAVPEINLEATPRVWLVDELGGVDRLGRPRHRPADQPQHHADREQPARVGEHDRVLDRLLHDQRRRRPARRARAARSARASASCSTRIASQHEHARCSRRRRRRAAAAPSCRRATRGRRAAAARTRARRRRRSPPTACAARRARGPSRAARSPAATIP